MHIGSDVMMVECMMMVCMLVVCMYYDVIYDAHFSCNS